MALNRPGRRLVLWRLRCAGPQREVYGRFTTRCRRLSESYTSLRTRYTLNSPYRMAPVVVVWLARRITFK